jgi:hypothetical protein
MARPFGTKYIETPEYINYLPRKIKGKLKELNVYYNKDTNELILSYKTKDNKIVENILPIYDMNINTIKNETDFHSKLLGLINKELSWLNTST